MNAPTSLTVTRLGRLALLAAGTAAAALAQNAAAPAPRPAAAPPFPGAINRALRDMDPAWKDWDVGVNVRLRHEDKDGAGTTDAGSNWDFSKRPQDDTHNVYQLLRILPRVGYTGARWSFLVEARSSYSYDDDRYSPTAPGHNVPELDGPLDLHQAYLVLGQPKNNPLTLKLGRQELAYGDQRLVGHARWLNVPRTFDAAKVRLETDGLALEVFTSRVVYTQDRRLNRSNPRDNFSGAYLTLPKAARHELVEAYLFSRNVARRSVLDDWSRVAAPVRLPAPQDLYTLGLRWKSKPGARGAWDYTLEAMYQFGDRTAVFPATPVAAALAAPRLEHTAWAAIGQVGYGWSRAPWSPRLAVTASLASGDGNASDGASHTFQNLFPSNHLLYGAMDLTGLQNARDLRFSLTVKPQAKLSLSLEVNCQSLMTARDFWYNAAGAPRNFTGAAAGSGAGYRINPTYGRTLGQEVDLLGTWTVRPGTTLEFGACRYFRGSYIKQSLATAGSQDATYAYLQLTVGL